MKKFFSLLFACIFLCGCQGLYNKTLENVFGFEKRELLQKAVESVKGDQVEAQKEFQDAMSELQSLYGFKGGKLEKMYNKFKDSYEDSKEQAEAVHERVDNMDRIANSMFKEWSKEIRQFSSKEFAADSRRKLDSTKERYQQLIESARKSEAAMEPILKKLHDHVLYLKHNLNAASLGALQGETKSIQVDVQELNRRMDESIREANSFISILREPS
jgi:hypothetical protein